MKASYHLIKPEDLFWRPSNPMQIPNADYQEVVNLQATSLVCR
jgi:hypothetical protein